MLAPAQCANTRAYCCLERTCDVSKELPVLQAGSSFDSDATGEFIWYQHADERERIMATYHNLTVAQIQAKRARGDVFHFIDVREPYEHAIAHIEGAELLPLSQANTWIDSLPSDEEIIFFCHHGSRSAQVAAFLAGQRGFTNVANMLGGIEAWAIQIDPQVPRY